jgi:hypothetical protein
VEINLQIFHLRENAQTKGVFVYLYNLGRNHMLERAVNNQNSLEITKKWIQPI